MAWSPNREALRGRVAVVAGATRGAGRGIAAALGEAGATVVCTGRSTRSTRSDYNRAETIEETAELVTHLGGTGIAAAVDHLEPDQVKNLAEQIRKEHNHSDVLVNDIWGAGLLKGGPADWNTPIWEHKLDNGLRILRLAIDAHLITSHYLLPLLIDKPGGLLVEVTDGTADYNASHYRIEEVRLSETSERRTNLDQPLHLPGLSRQSIPRSQACREQLRPASALRFRFVEETSRVKPGKPGGLSVPPAIEARQESRGSTQ